MSHQRYRSSDFAGDFSNYPRTYIYVIFEISRSDCELKPSRLTHRATKNLVFRQRGLRENEYKTNSREKFSCERKKGSRGVFSSRVTEQIFAPTWPCERVVNCGDRGRSRSFAIRTFFSVWSCESIDVSSDRDSEAGFESRIVHWQSHTSRIQTKVATKAHQLRL